MRPALDSRHFVSVLRAGAVAAFALLLASCTSTPVAVQNHPDAGPPCKALFGNPNALTGLTTDQCKPSCVCGGSDFTPPVYSAAFIQSLLDDWKLATPYPPITVDPYANAAAPPTEPAGTVCAVVPQGAAGTVPRPYELETYASETLARAAFAKPTHFGGCGVCSTLENLAVYMRENDLTAPVRSCGLKGLGGGEGAVVSCLQKLGFDLPCAQAWYYDSNNTESVCLSMCISEIGAPYQEPDGSLNPCIQCDEDKSGPIFKVVAGRTRRNSGLPNALCRPCSEVEPLVHSY